MFTIKRVVILVVVAILLTALLYYIDTDPPTDGMNTRLINTSMVLVIVTAVYVVGCKIFKR